MHFGYEAASPEPKQSELAVMRQHLLQAHGGKSELMERSNPLRLLREFGKVRELEIDENAADRAAHLAKSSAFLQHHGWALIHIGHEPSDAAAEVLFPAQRGRATAMIEPWSVRGCRSTRGHGIGCQTI